VKRWRDRVSRLFGLVATGFLAAMLLLTVADVVLRATLNLPIRGVYDLVEFLLTGTFFFALPCTFLRDDNIVVNSIDDIAPRWVPSLKRAGDALGVVVLFVMAWQAFIAAGDSYAFHDVTADLGLPRIWHWLVLLAGILCAALAALAMAVRVEDRS
jgi:TRAP-type C4-dicarboxylate transport system permease small subunit